LDGVCYTIRIDRSGSVIILISQDESVSLIFIVTTGRTMYRTRSGRPGLFTGSLSGSIRRISGNTALKNNQKITKKIRWRFSNIRSFPGAGSSAFTCSDRGGGWLLLPAAGCGGSGSHCGRMNPLIHADFVVFSGHYHWRHRNSAHGLFRFGGGAFGPEGCDGHQAIHPAH